MTGLPDGWTNAALFARALHCCHRPSRPVSGPHHDRGKGKSSMGGGGGAGGVGCGDGGKMARTGVGAWFGGDGGRGSGPALMGEVCHAPIQPWELHQRVPVRDKGDVDVMRLRRRLVLAPKRPGLLFRSGLVGIDLPTPRTKKRD